MMDDDQEKLLFEVANLKNKVKRERESHRVSLAVIYLTIGVVGFGLLIGNFDSWLFLIGGWIVAALAVQLANKNVPTNADE
jgi:fatty acid desaturase